MRKDDIQVFVEGLISYYAIVTNKPAEVGTPYLVSDINDIIKEYAGIIGITGRYSGNVIFTAPKPMLMQLLARYPGNEYDGELLLDLVGEIANTVSGNAREKLGSDFQLAPPVVSRGRLDSIKIASGLQTYCIPIVWEKRSANLIVALA